MLKLKNFNIEEQKTTIQNLFLEINKFIFYIYLYIFKYIYTNLYIFIYIYTNIGINIIYKFENFIFIYIKHYFKSINF